MHREVDSLRILNTMLPLVRIVILDLNNGCVSRVVAIGTDYCPSELNLALYRNKSNLFVVVSNMK